MASEMVDFAHPILTCKESMAFERELLGSDEGAEWKAMERAGRGVARALMEDFQQIGRLPVNPRVLVLSGRGHNGGDAILAADEILSARPKASFTVVLVYGDKGLKPHVRKALDILLGRGGAVEVISWRADSAESPLEAEYDLCLDGVLGMQFRPPWRPPAEAAIEQVNGNTGIRFRAAVDLPSGVGDESEALRFRADFTYATGIAKAPLFDRRNAASVGRIRYVDIGFFEGRTTSGDNPLILHSSVLRPLQRLRDPISDKRSFGHLFVVGGSRTMPGAILMAVRAAVKSGVGLVTAFVPESVAASFAAVMPEAMWVPFPETPMGGLALEGFHLLTERLSGATALLMGPGMGNELETGALLDRIVREAARPLVIDADALQPELIDAVRDRSDRDCGVVLTPHEGEWQRIRSCRRGEISLHDLGEFSRDGGVVTVLKGPITTISNGQRIIHSCFGGPVLARGGSGDILSGLVGGMLARPAADPLVASCRAVALQGCAADLLARSRGQTAVRTTEILEFLPAALRNVP